MKTIPVSEWQKLYDGLRDAEDLLADKDVKPQDRIENALLRIRIALDIAEPMRLADAMVAKL